MRLVFIMEGLECRECADKIEAHIQRTAGVEAACLMFEAHKFVIECADGEAERVAAEVKRSTAKAQGSARAVRVRRSELVRAYRRQALVLHGLHLSADFRYGLLRDSGTGGDLDIGVILLHRIQNAV